MKGVCHQKPLVSLLKAVEREFQTTFMVPQLTMVIHVFDEQVHLPGAAWEDVSISSISLMLFSILSFSRSTVRWSMPRKP